MGEKKFKKNKHTRTKKTYIKQVRNKDYRKVILARIVAILAIVIFLYYGAKNYNVSLSPKPEIYVSSYNLMQADTLLVTVKNETNKITGKFGDINLRFFNGENDNGWIAITGIPINKNPGDYKLSINVPGIDTFKKNITVLKRNFPLTKLAITPELLNKGYTAKKIVTTIDSIENKALNEVLNVINPDIYVKKPFIYPLSDINVVGNFGDIRAAQGYQVQHFGVDLKAAMGTFVYAVNDGKAVFMENLPNYGKMVIIDHGFGMYSLYLHLSEFKVTKGQMVTQGDIVALSGDTGYATGPHLHFSIKVRGAALDPLKFIGATQTSWIKF
ncbi:MAG: peptidoglycan DD-metalloendopeptidase family protein [Candidatus Staskawiczbacteria bacterium]|nr:peptidoglycan DD-metalloendopeptidase family protein [Candidatus Staskawiczbacteria bacterium]MBI3337412.1 peptidoglycan DD-metalloendopeptidase family protein [Candidatus Staskawiczbacteria bacterium]